MTDIKTVVYNYEPINIEQHQPYCNDPDEIKLVLTDISSQGLDVQTASCILIALNKYNKLHGIQYNPELFVYEVLKDHVVMMNLISNNTAYVKSMTIDLFNKIVGSKTGMVQLRGINVRAYIPGFPLAYIEGKTLISSLRDVSF
jgi:hypothetical protein